MTQFPHKFYQLMVFCWVLQQKWWIHISLWWIHFYLSRVCFFFWKKLAIFWYPYFLFIRFLVKSFSLYISDKTTSWVTPSCLTVSWEKVDSISSSEHLFFVFLQTFLLISSISVFHYALSSPIFCVIFHLVFEFLILVIFWMPWMMNNIR